MEKQELKYEIMGLEVDVIVYKECEEIINVCVLYLGSELVCDSDSVHDAIEQARIELQEQHAFADEFFSSTQNGGHQ